jgi:hypothetical protein
VRARTRLFEAALDHPARLTHKQATGGKRIESRLLDGSHPRPSAYRCTTREGAGGGLRRPAFSRMLL